MNGSDEIIETLPLTVASLLAQSKVEALEMASVQLNGDFLSRERYATTTLSDGDEVDFLYLMGGGARR